MMSICYIILLSLNRIASRRYGTYSSLYVHEANITDLSLFNTGIIQNFRMRKWCERSYRPISDSYLTAERFKIDPVGNRNKYL